MKKYISIFSFMALFFVGMQQSNAQDSVAKTVKTERPEAIAKKQTYELHQQVTLTGEQQSGVFHVFVDYQKELKAIRDGKDEVLAEKQEKALKEKVNEKLKKMLTTEQFKTYAKSITPKEDY